MVWLFVILFWDWEANSELFKNIQISNIFYSSVYEKLVIQNVWKFMSKKLLLMNEGEEKLTMEILRAYHFHC